MKVAIYTEDGTTQIVLTPEGAFETAVMANALDKNKALDAVYTPVTVARARQAQATREVGRGLLEQEVGRAKSRKHPPGGV